MTDKEVGELWTEHIRHCSEGNECPEIRLIKKVVEERIFSDGSFKRALDEFGIPLEEWEKARES